MMQRTRVLQAIRRLVSTMFNVASDTSSFRITLSFSDGSDRRRTRGHAHQENEESLSNDKLGLSQAIRSVHTIITGSTDDVIGGIKSGYRNRAKVTAGRKT
jgi:hypothetical protein